MHYSLASRVLPKLDYSYRVLYQQGAACPDGYAPVLDESACSSAATRLGKEWGGVLNTTGLVPGCSEGGLPDGQPNVDLNGNGLIYFVDPNVTTYGTGQQHYAVCSKPRAGIGVHYAYGGTCPSGYRDVDNKQECLLAAHLLGKGVGNSEKLANETVVPGCHEGALVHGEY